MLLCAPEVVEGRFCFVGGGERARGDALYATQ